MKTIRNEKERGKGPEKLFEEITAEISLEKGISHPTARSVDSPWQDKSKEEHTEIHINQTDKN